MFFHREQFWVVEKIRLVADRVRAHYWRFRGARLGAKTRVGARCRITRPWAFSTGYRCVLEEGIYIKLDTDNSALSLGDGVFVGRFTQFDLHDDLRVGSQTLIAPNVFVTDFNHRSQTGLTIASQGCEVKAVSVGNDCWIGAGSHILAGAKLGDGAIVAAAAVVTRDVGKSEIVAGLPARRVGNRS